MIKLNNRECEWHPGLTVKELLTIKQYTYPRIVVSVNKVIVPEEEYASTIIQDGDIVEAIHLMAGG